MTSADLNAAPEHASVTRRSLLRGAAAGGALAALAPAARADQALAPAADRAAAPASGQATAAGPTALAGRGHREYWLSVESFAHDLVPTGFDQMMGQPVSGSRYQALGYRAYSPGFGHALAADQRPGGIGLNSGIPGPLLHAQVGDTVTVHLRNNDAHFKWPHSFHVHGWRYDGASDGAWTYRQRSAAPRLGSAVPYRQTYTYRYTVPENAVGTWPYHDHSMPELYTGANPAEANPMEISAELGMFGIIAVTGPGTPTVDREIYLFFHDLYQADIPVLSRDFDCFNGRAYLGNTPVFTARVGERVRWRIAALGKEFHVFHLHGHRWSNGHSHTDSQILGPSTTLTVEYVEDNPGDWLYHCHVTDHMQGGMVGLYRVAR